MSAVAAGLYLDVGNWGSQQEYLQLLELMFPKETDVGVQVYRSHLAPSTQVVELLYHFALDVFGDVLYFRDAVYFRDSVQSFRQVCWAQMHLATHGCVFEAV